MRDAREHYEGHIERLVAERDAFRWSLIITEAERDDALWTLERVNGRAQMADFDMGYVETSKVLRDIRAMCERGLKK